MEYEEETRSQSSVPGPTSKFDGVLDKAMDLLSDAASRGVVEVEQEEAFAKRDQSESGVVMKMTKKITLTRGGAIKIFTRQTHFFPSTQEARDAAREKHGSHTREVEETVSVPDSQETIILPEISPPSRPSAGPSGGPRAGPSADPSIRLRPAIHSSRWPQRRRPATGVVFENDSSSSSDEEGEGKEEGYPFRPLMNPPSPITLVDSDETCVDPRDLPQDPEEGPAPRGEKQEPNPWTAAEREWERVPLTDIIGQDFEPSISLLSFQGKRDREEGSGNGSGSSPLDLWDIKVPTPQWPKKKLKTGWPPYQPPPIPSSQEGGGREEETEAPSQPLMNTDDFSFLDPEEGRESLNLDEATSILLELQATEEEDEGGETEIIPPYNPSGDLFGSEEELVSYFEDSQRY